MAEGDRDYEDCGGAQNSQSNVGQLPLKPSPTLAPFIPGQISRAVVPHAARIAPLNSPSPPGVRLLRPVWLPAYSGVARLTTQFRSDHHSNSQGLPLKFEQTATYRFFSTVAFVVGSPPPEWGSRPRMVRPIRQPPEIPGVRLCFRSSQVCGRPNRLAGHTIRQDGLPVESVLCPIVHPPRTPPPQTITPIMSSRFLRCAKICGVCNVHHQSGQTD
ncbi:hypothetical protein AHiyo1_00130 [Arthrobacter sp. Hiyo1]|nr:hypothetical protein AHiyo1_00130 [Arthrobacter sp. Hiyo1]